jgi:cytochrome c peroxidase
MVEFYNNGGRVNADDPFSPFLSGGIRPLNLTDQQKADLVEFLRALTSPQIAAQVTSTEIIE